MQPMFSGYWVVLPQEVRNRMKMYFNVQKSSGSHVENGRLVSDGHTDEDLKAVSVEKMQTLLNSKEDDQVKLVEATIQHFKDQVANEQIDLEKKAKQEYEEVTKQEEVAVADVMENVVKEVAKRRGKKFRK
jgi:hypothetical protein